MAWTCPACKTINEAESALCVACGMSATNNAAPPVEAAPTVPVAVYERASPLGPVQGAQPSGQNTSQPPAPARQRSRLQVVIGLVAALVVAALCGFAAAKLAAPSEGGSGPDSSNAGAGSEGATAGPGGRVSTTSDADLEEPATVTSDPAPTLSSPEDPTPSAGGSPSGVGLELSTRDALGFSLLVPVGWTADEDIPGGSSSTVTYTDPNSRASIRFSYNGCVGCVDKGMVEGSDDVGVPYPEAYVPEDAIAQQRLSDWAIAFATTAPDPGFSTDGLIKVIDDGGPAGAIVVEVTLPTSQHSVATEILNSV